LNLARAYEHQQLHDLKEQLFTNMFKVMVDRGLVDEAAKEIHDASLGGVLKRLAMHVKGETTLVKEDNSPVKENESAP
jgi:hypothetical protein